MAAPIETASEATPAQSEKTTFALTRRANYQQDGGATQLPAAGRPADPYPLASASSLAIARASSMSG